MVSQISFYSVVHDVVVVVHDVVVYVVVVVDVVISVAYNCVAPS